MNIAHDVIDMMFVLPDRELHTQNHHFYQNASGNQIYFSQVICPGYIDFKNTVECAAYNCTGA